MSDRPEPSQSHAFVPASFADLRRNTRAEGEALDRALKAKTQGPEDFADLVADGGFMRQSKWIGIGGIAVGALLILAVYFKPMFETADAVQTAAAAAKANAQAKLAGVGRAADQVQAIKDTDMKAINMAKGGLNCLSGKGACDNGTSSPFK